ncbi:hypothetical protein [Brevundimonas sp. SL161]|uniref:hypothetical protein n=1 Tax=Brevundimonas sp. SL161 TaxID=2804613 RepID=UPI003CF5315A
MIGYLQHGRAGEPMRTERVEAKESPMPHQVAGLTWTASGYGERIPTAYMVRVVGRWRRVYCYVFSNSGTLFIGRNLRTGIIVDLDRDTAEASQ